MTQRRYDRETLQRVKRFCADCPWNGARWRGSTGCAAYNLRWPLWLGKEGLAVALALAGAVLNARRNVRGFGLWVISNTIWIGIGLARGLHGLALQMLVFLGISIYGIRYWTREGESK